MDKKNLLTFFIFLLMLIAVIMLGFLIFMIYTQGGECVNNPLSYMAENGYTCFKSFSGPSR